MMNLTNVEPDRLVARMKVGAVLADIEAYSGRSVEMKANHC